MRNHLMKSVKERSNWMRIVSIFTAVIIATLTPLNALAAPQFYETTNQCKKCQIQRISLSNELDILTVKDKDGEEYRIATKTQDEKSGTRMFFWVIQNDEELMALQRTISNKEDNPVQYNHKGYVNLPAGGWVYWNADSIRVYISPDIAADWTMGFGIAAILCGIVAALPLGTLPGTFCATVFGLSAGTIAYYDVKGNPGFYIVGTRNPVRVWLEP